MLDSTDRQLSHVSDDSGIFGSLSDTQECPDELAVRRSFVFLKENIIYQSLQDDLKQRDLLSDREEDDYVCKTHNRYTKCERLIKLIIKKKRCKEFVDLMNKKTCHCHVAEKIEHVRKQVPKLVEAKKDAKRRKPPFAITVELLQKHSSFLHEELEPREVVDEMFEAGHISVREHDAVSDCDRKYSRVTGLLDILEKRTALLNPFLFALQSLKCVLVLETLQKDRKLKHKPSEYAVCIQQNFCLLKEELPDSKDARVMVDQMYGFLDETNVSDIDHFHTARQQKSKLLKILLMKGKPACKELFIVVDVDLNRGDLINRMKERSGEIKKRGKPTLDLKLRSLQISCLQKHEEFLLDELEPLHLSDLLFEESALNIPDHDRITEKKGRGKQVEYFLDTVKKKDLNCFHIFLYILKKEEYTDVLEELVKSDSGFVGVETNEKLNCTVSHSFTAASSHTARAPHESVNVRLSMQGPNGKQLEQALHQQIQSKDTRILEEAIVHGQMDIEDVATGSVVIQLRPVTDQAVQILLNARENNRLVEMVLGMLKRVNAPDMMQGTESLEVRVQVSYASSAAAKSRTSKAALIKERIKAQRSILISELEPRALVSVLSKSNHFSPSAMDSIKTAPSCHKRTEMLLSFIENGNPEAVEYFVTALKDLGYCDIVELIDPSDIHSRAENIRKVITSNYKVILDEMQITLAKETLSKCIGDVATIREKILPKNGKRRQRMNHFLQFILQEDHNVIEFEKMLRNNGLEELLKVDETVQGEHIATQDIELTVIEDQIPLSEEVLFESTLTLSFSVTNDREIREEEHKAMLKMEEQQLVKKWQEEMPQREHGLERLQQKELPASSTSPEKSFGGNESFSSVSSSSSLQSIISDVVEEEKSKTSKFTKDIRFNLQSKTDKKRLSAEKFSPQKEVASFSPHVESPPPVIPPRPKIFQGKSAESLGPSTSVTQTAYSSSYLLVAAIDIGTTYSGYAFSWKVKPQLFCTSTYKSSEKLSEKEPSVLLMDKSTEQMVAFGQEAMEKYKSICDDEEQNDYFYFSYFKMILHRDEKLNRKTLIQDDKGRECLAVTVFSMSIKYFKDKLLGNLDRCQSLCGTDDIRWVLTVPAIWGEQAKQMMQESANQAGISPCNVLLALEPEVASMFVKEIQIERQDDELSKYRPGKKFLVMDLGGGTADMTAMEVVNDGSLKQLHRASGGDWGGNKVNDNFFQLLHDLFGRVIIQKCEDRYRSDFLDLQRDIELKKRKFSKSVNFKMKFAIPYSFKKVIESHHRLNLKEIVAKSKFSPHISVYAESKLELSAYCVETILFNPVVNMIKQEAENIMHELKGQIQDIMMVGGFSESHFVFETIKEAFPRIRIIRANEAGLAVLKGAVLYGHTPGVISSRRCAFTYGVGLYRIFWKGHDPEHLKCKMDGQDNIFVFEKLVTIGEEVEIGQTYEINDDIAPVKRGVTQMSLKIYRSCEENPIYIDESSFQIGKLTVNGVTKSVKISLSFGSTQITVTAVNTVTGENVIAELDLLGEL